MTDYTQASFKTHIFSASNPKDDAADGTGNTKITFDAQQQEKVNELIREAQGRAAKEVRAELATTKTEMQALQARVEAAEKAATKGTPAQKAAASDDAVALKAELDEVKVAHANLQAEVARKDEYTKRQEGEVRKAQNQVLQTRKEVEMRDAANSCNFVNPALAMKAFGDQIEWDTDRKQFVVMGDNGSVRFNSALEPMSPAEYFAEVATKNPYLVRGDVRSGSGSTERTGVTANGRYKLEDLFGPKSNSKLTNSLALTNPAEYKRLRAQAKDAGLVH